MPPSTTVTIHGHVVRDLLRRDGDTISALAERMPVDRSWLHKLLNGEERCSWHQLLAMAAALRVEPTTIADVQLTDTAAG